MMMNTPSEVQERRQSLWTLTTAPAVWAAHLLVTYAVAATWCGAAGRHASLGPLRVAFGVGTLLALAAVGVVVWQGWVRYQLGDAVPTHHRDTPEDRHRFLGLATFLLALLSGVAMLFLTLAVALVGNCS